MNQVKLLIAVSGKRHTGKDYFSLILKNKLQEYLNIRTEFVHVSDELKKEYAVTAGLDVNLLQNDRTYKETHRVAMTKFCNEQMERFGSDYYNRIFSENILKKTTEPTIYIVDCRHHFEVNLYRRLEPLPLLLMRINVDDSIRRARGWKFDANIDNHQSEIDMDNYDSWDLVFENNADGEASIIDFVDTKLIPNIRKLIN